MLQFRSPLFLTLLVVLCAVFGVSVLRSMFFPQLTPWALVVAAVVAFPVGWWLARRSERDDA